MDERTESVLNSINRIDGKGMQDFLSEIACAVMLHPRERFVFVTVSGAELPIEFWHNGAAATLRKPYSIQADTFKEKLNLEHKKGVQLVAYGKNIEGAMWLEYRIDTDIFLECEYLHSVEPW